MIDHNKEEQIIRAFVRTKRQMLSYGNESILFSHFEGRLDGMIEVMNVIDPSFAETLLTVKQSG